MTVSHSYWSIAQAASDARGDNVSDTELSPDHILNAMLC